MGAAALLRAGRSHRQLPLSNVKYRRCPAPLMRGVPGTFILKILEASAATRGAPSYSPGLSAFYANLHRIKRETIRRAHAMHLTAIHRLAGVTVRSHHLTGR